MRRKIAKRWRKKILQHATIIEEHWETYKEPNKPKKRDDMCYVVRIECNGWKISAPEYDELSAYKAAWDCVEMAQTLPPDFCHAYRREKNG